MNFKFERNKTKLLPVRFDEATLLKLEYIAGKEKVSSQEVVRAFVAEALEEYQAAEEATTKIG